MRWHRIWIEQEAIEFRRTREILNRLGNPSYKTIENIDDVFGRAFKPYWHRNFDRNLFLAVKRGKVIKEAPEAYGTKGESHYYFIHALNCIYECEYCYLQGYFSSPDLVLYMNHEEIADHIFQHANKNPSSWYHAGEFSDCLALAWLTQEWQVYREMMSYLPNHQMELRTKSADIRVLKNILPLKNFIVSYSMSPQKKAQKVDRRTATVSARIRAMEKLVSIGHPVALHLDPIIYSNSLELDYRGLLEELVAKIPPQKIRYVSIGSLRFSKESFHSLKKNYPDSEILQERWLIGQDGKVRYPAVKSRYSLNIISKVLKENGFNDQQIYRCME